MPPRSARPGRMRDWKVVLMEQRSKQLLCWFEPHVHQRLNRRHPGPAVAYRAELLEPGKRALRIEGLSRRRR